MKTATLIDLARQRVAPSTDYRLAKVLGVTRQAVSEWRSGSKYPSLRLTYEMAEMAELDPAVVAGEIERHRAELAGRASEASAWGRVLERISGTAAAVVLGTALIGPSPAQSSSVARTYGDSSAGPMYIMSTRRRAWRAMVDALAGFVAGPRMRLA